jgi:hypothetical protein
VQTTGGYAGKPNLPPKAIALMQRLLNGNCCWYNAYNSDFAIQRKVVQTQQLNDIVFRDHLHVGEG